MIDYSYFNQAFTNRASKQQPSDQVELRGAILSPVTEKWTQTFQFSMLATQKW